MSQIILLESYIWSKTNSYLFITCETTSFRILRCRGTLKLSKYSPTASEKAGQSRDAIFWNYPSQCLKWKVQVNNKYDVVQVTATTPERKLWKELKLCLEQGQKKGEKLLRHCFALWDERLSHSLLPFSLLAWTAGCRPLWNMNRSGLHLDIWAYLK